MTAAKMVNLSGPTAVPLNSERLQVGPTFLVVLVAILVVSALNLADPIIRHDDYPAYFADPSGFWLKTLYEGRWLNYIWHMREIVTPSWLNFLVYQALWALFAASLAVVASGKKGADWFTVVLALMIVVSPSAYLISAWFNTLLPGLAIVALFGFLSCRVSNRTLRFLLPPFVILTFMAYTMYPLLLLAVCIARTEQKSFADLTGLMLLFIMSFAVAVLTVYAINWQVHGIFGVPVADWREPTAAHDLAGMLQNMPKLTRSLSVFLHRNSYGFAPAIFFLLSMLTLSTIVLWKRAPMEALYLVAGLSIGLGLVAVQALKLGVIVPPRAFAFAWIFFALIFVRAVQLLSQKEGWSGRLARNAALLVVGSYLLKILLVYALFSSWHADTKALAQDLEQVSGPVYVYGNPSKISSARKAGIQSREALTFRIKFLTGRDVITCKYTPELCGSEPALVKELEQNTEAEIHVRRIGSATYVVFVPEDNS